MALKEAFAKLAHAADDKTGGRMRLLGARFRRDIGAQSNPVKEIAVGFILIGISVVIALTFWPIITASVATAQGDANTSSTDGTLLGLLPTTLVVGLIAGGVAFLFRGFRAITTSSM